MTLWAKCSTSIPSNANPVLAKHAPSWGNKGDLTLTLIQTLITIVVTSELGGAELHEYTKEYTRISPSNSNSSKKKKRVARHLRSH